MNFSFIGKIRIIIIIMILIFLIQGIIIMNLIAKLCEMESLQMDIRNTIWISWFIFSVFSLILIFYLPVFLNKAFSGIHSKLKEISQGKYDTPMDLKLYEKTMDNEFYTVLLSIRETLKSIRNFDNLKKDKIIEHHNRIKALLNLSSEGFIITDKKGNIVYINDIVTEVFPQLTEKVNIIDNNFPPDIENNFKRYIAEVLKTERKKDPQQFFFPVLKRHIGLNGSLIRDSEGKTIGAVFIFTNIEKKKTE